MQSKLVNALPEELIAFGITPEEWAFIEMIRNNPGKKLSRDDEIGKNGELLYRRPFFLGADQIRF